ncbi:MAG: aminodeoxychorismate lyase [Neptuniibacter caesariensis]|uniref:Aminodeoxychorismate lyase n=1 Tax=Neptuniibacter caesariensis TaxID=207954 RepID=A0A2G6JK51_NEPCE|nr:MAG: aminodeoxychorismate lyase [Neptuniibacter caesariensis]
MQCWVNGLESDQLSVQDRGLAYGDGLFETILIQASKPCLLDEHLQRLARGLQALSFPDSVLDELRADLKQLVLPEQAVLKIIITRGQGDRGYLIPAVQSANRILLLSPVGDFTDQRNKGVRLRLCQYKLSIQPILAGIKHLNRLDQVLARAEWDDPEIAEGIVSDIDSFIVEGTMSNLFWVKNGCLYTPEIDRCGVQGVMRDHIIRLATAAELSVETGHYYKNALLAADEAFICNSVVGIWPVIAIAEQAFAIGPMTRDLQQMLSEELTC